MLKNHQLVNQTDTEFDWFTFSEWLSGPTAFCLLIPAQGATGPSRPEVKLSLGEQATVAVATPKIKMFPAVCVATADGGVSMPPEMLEVPPLQAAEGHLYLKKGGNFYLQQLSHPGWTSAGLGSLVCNPHLIVVYITAMQYRKNMHGYLAN